MITIITDSKGNLIITEEMRDEARKFAIAELLVKHKQEYKKIVEKELNLVIRRIRDRKGLILE